jgi:hypothetical protein
MTTTTEPRAKTTVELWKDGGWTRWTAHFADADQALAYIARRNEGLDVLDRERVNIDPLFFDPQLNWAGDVVVETFPPAGPLTPSQLRLMDYLNPTCHHGMSADLCMDPYGDNHWGTMDQEMARGW